MESEKSVEKIMYAQGSWEILPEPMLGWVVTYDNKNV